MPDRPVRELIQHGHVIAVPPSASVREAAQQMSEHRCGSVLVCAGEELLGILTERDVLNRVVAQCRDPETTKVTEVMTARPDVIAADLPIKDAIRMMDEFGYRHLPVTEAGKVVAVLSMRDLPFTELSRMAKELDDRHVLAERMW
jgi:CBS domain-containing protein